MKNFIFLFFLFVIKTQVFAQNGVERKMFSCQLAIFTSDLTANNSTMGVDYGDKYNQDFSDFKSKAYDELSKK